MQPPPPLLLYCVFLTPSPHMLFAPFVLSVPFPTPPHALRPLHALRPSCSLPPPPVLSASPPVFSSFPPVLSASPRVLWLPPCALWTPMLFPSPTCLPHLCSLTPPFSQGKPSGWRAGKGPVNMSWAALSKMIGPIFCSSPGLASAQL